MSGGASVRLHHVPAGDDVAGSELFEDHAGHGTRAQGSNGTSLRFFRLEVPSLADCGPL